MNSLTDCFVLSNGVKVPCVGFGTWQTPTGDVAVQSVLAALKAGYRHIDTAWGYENEPEVGDAVRASGVPREEVFITSKHWVISRGYQKTIEAVEASLRNFKLDYMDLYLVHWPCVAKSSPQWKEINADTWRGFERMYKDGKIRAIGVSNYQKKHIEGLYEYCTVKPMVNQIEFHPGYTQMDNVRYCQEQGIVVEAWSPLGNGAVLKSPFLAAIAAKYGKSVAQLCVRFALQCDVLPLPKSVHADRIVQNAEVFDFTISDEDMQAIMDMPQLGFSGYLPEDAPADILAGLLPPDKE